MNKHTEAALSVTLPMAGFLLATGVPAFGPPMEPWQVVVWVILTFVGLTAVGVGLGRRSKRKFESCKEENQQTASP